MTMKTKRQRAAGTAIAVAALLALAGCGEAKQEAAPVTLDERQATLYEHACKTCHEDPATGAPRTHDTVAWAPRIAKGEDVLLDNIVNGFNGMPPLGQCIECDADDFISLTMFMAAPASNETGDAQ
ncbi:c-type cytochrome [Parvibaculum sp.]|jgi:cytochrome c5|uniref:c-type cytochrome n=1 Tax=Parvibaculum sp. TaxID=2024848 RepID=UPI003262EFE7